MAWVQYYDTNRIETLTHNRCQFIMRKIIITIILIFSSFLFGETIRGVVVDKAKICAILNMNSHCLDFVEINVVKNYEELNRQTSHHIPEWGVGVAIPEKNRILITESGDAEKIHKILHHELTHIALHRKLRGIPIPRWFDEGIANYLAGGFEISQQAQIAWAVLWRKVISLSALEQVYTFNSADAELAYAESHDAILFLAEYSPIGSICDSIAHYGEFEKGFQTAVRMNIYQFYREWEKHLGRKYLPFVILGDSRFLWTFIVIFLLVFGMVKFIKQRTHFARLRQQADEQGWNEPPEHYM